MVNAPLRIAVTDPIISAFADDLRRTRRVHDWRFVGAEDPASVRDALAWADVLVCARLAAADVPVTNHIRLIHVSGAGVDRVDLTAVSPEVFVCNTGHHGPAIAEHVMMTALMLRRRALATNTQMRDGVWQTISTAPGTPYHRLLDGDTLGLIGFGEIGRSVARLAAAFGMRIVAMRRNPAAHGLDTELLDHVYGEHELHAVLQASDVVILTAPLTERTRGFIDADALAQMREDAVIINVARGPLIDEDALYEALHEHRIGGAAIDVWWDAPDGTAAPPAVARFASLDRVVLTPHHSGHAADVFIARATDIARNIDLLDEGLPLERRVR